MNQERSINKKSDGDVFESSDGREPFFQYTDIEFAAIKSALPPQSSENATKSALLQVDLIGSLMIGLESGSRKELNQQLNPLKGLFAAIEFIEAHCGNLVDERWEDKGVLYRNAYGEIFERIAKDLTDLKRHTLRDIIHLKENHAWSKPAKRGERTRHALNRIAKAWEAAGGTVDGGAAYKRFFLAAYLPLARHPQIAAETAVATTALTTFRHHVTERNQARGVKGRRGRPKKENAEPAPGERR